MGEAIRYQKGGIRPAPFLCPSKPLLVARYALPNSMSKGAEGLVPEPEPENPEPASPAARIEPLLAMRNPGGSSDGGSKRIQGQS